jgi:hypothetical protein
MRYQWPIFKSVSGLTRKQEHQKSVLRPAGQDLNNTFWQMDSAARFPMPNAQDLIERARMFEERAERASDPISRQHYREMAAHYRSLAVEHRETRATQLERGNISDYR